MSAGMGETMRTRAIASTLTARLSPTVPSASQTYEPLVRSALRQRLIHNIFAFSAAFTLIVSILFGGEDETSAFARLLSPGTWMMACLKWSVGVLPVIAMRKVYLTSATTPATSPAKMLTNAIAKPSTRRCLAVYMSCTLMLISLYMSTFTSEERENLRLNVFVKSRKHPYYLNGRLLFLIQAQLWLAASFLVRNIMLDRFVFRWTKPLDSLELPYAPSNLLRLLLTMALFTSFSSMMYSVAFGLSRMLVLPLLLKLPVASSIVRPFVANFAWFGIPGQATVELTPFKRVTGGYSKFRFTRYPSLTQQIDAHVEGIDPLNSVGPYWEQPGRSILDNHLIEVPEGNEVVPGVFSDFESDHYPSLPSPRSVIMRKKMTWDDLLSYLNTWSVLHTFRQHNPTDWETPRGDVAVRFCKDLKEGVEREDGRAVEGHDEVDIEWPLAMIMVKRA
ncbi:hypothetical protein EV702DRAFT_1194727 [Suillus placidus]|uniref:Uncharacterized protein n=1 Tax=Suillus placidus TaxID=48579 RepID=A0A9P7D5L4_9AGAM|nr:hypothetical protein EV702DRAFT_1194727 [Suillus placidus]